MRSSPTESLLVFSDVHLGSDLNDSGPTVPRSVAIDRDLAALLAHYRTQTPPADRWRLVIAGDFIDFVGMSIDQRDGDVLETEPTARERAFGLGGAEDHVRLKLKRAAARHPDVFDELAAFVAGGNALTLIHGNHDLELHWESVQADFCALLSKTDPSKTAEIAARIEFQPWFFHREGFVFIEHGHQYDPFCATPHILAPLCPSDPRRVLQSLSDTLLRYIVRRTPGMKEYGHENRGLMSYISWGLMLGGRGTVRLFRRFYDAVVMLRETARAYDSDTGAIVKAEHERRLASHAEATSLPEERLREALALHVLPLGRTPRGVLASVLIDRMAAALVMLVTLFAIAMLWGRLGGYGVHAVAITVAIWAVLHIVIARGRPSIDPAAVMIDRATSLSKLFSSSFVVMGHTHTPATTPIGDAIYVNLGSWAEEEPGPEEDLTKVYRAARTHLVLHAKEDRHEAQLCAWRSGEGPHTLHELSRPRKQDDVIEERPTQIAV